MGDISKTGGIRFTTPDGEQGFFPFPQDGELQKVLDQVEDPVLRDEFYRITKTNTVYHVTMAGASLPEGEGLNISVSDGAETEEYFTGYREESPESTGGHSSGPKSLCAIGTIASHVVVNPTLNPFVTPYYEKLFGPRTTPWEIGRWILPLVQIKYFCRTRPPTPPDAKGDPRDFILKDSRPEPVRVQVHQKSLLDVTTALLDVAVTGILIYLMGGAGLVLKPAGFIGTVDADVKEGA